MSDATAEILQQAYNLIEKEDLAQARKLLEPLLTSRKDNADVWWLYAHAVEDANEALNALSKIKQLAPDYPGVDELSEQLEEAFVIQGNLPAPTKSPSKAAREDDWELDFEDEDFDEEALEEEGEPRRRSLQTLILATVAIIVVVVIIFAVFAILSGGRPRPETTPLAAADETRQVTVDVTGTTQEPITIITPDITEESTVPVTTDITGEPQALTGDTDFTPLLEALSGFNVPEDGIELSETEIGSTLIITICAATGIAANDTLTGVMDVLARQTGNIAEPVDAFGIRIGDCSRPDSARLLGISADTVRAFANGDITPRDFQRSWTPIR